MLPRVNSVSSPRSFQSTTSKTPGPQGELAIVQLAMRGLVEEKTVARADRVNRERNHAMCWKRIERVFADAHLAIYCNEQTTTVFGGVRRCHELIDRSANCFFIQGKIEVRT